MAYILPVSNNQYEQYTERDIKKNYDPFHIGPLNKANATSTNNHANMVVAQGTPYKKAIKKKRSAIKKVSYHNEGKISEITGKGRNFNERI